MKDAVRCVSESCNRNTVHIIFPSLYLSLSFSLSLPLSLSGERVGWGTVEPASDWLPFKCTRFTKDEETQEENKNDAMKAEWLDLGLWLDLEEKDASGYNPGLWEATVWHSKFHVLFEVKFWVWHVFYYVCTWHLKASCLVITVFNRTTC